MQKDGTVVEHYVYDINGNRISRQLENGPVESATFDGQDRLTQLSGTVYQINADGFLAQRGNDMFDYSTRGELLQATVSGQAITYAYDGLRRRVGRTDSVGTSQYLYGDPGNLFLVTATRDPAGVLSILFYDDAGQLFAIERSGARYYVATDPMGTPLLVSDAIGLAVKMVTYDSFGIQTSDSNPGFDLIVGFAGGLGDATTGLVRFGFRDYDPQAGRWTSRDPALYDGGQGNLYAYARNNPVNNRDPLGLWCIGGSAYSGAGAGFQFCLGNEGVSVCAEVGFGVGANVSVDNGGLAKSGTEAGVKLKAGCGPASISTGITLDSEGCVKLTAPTAKLGPYSIDSKGKSTLSKTINIGEKGAKPTCSVEGKVYAKACKQSKW